MPKNIRKYQMRDELLIQINIKITCILIGKLNQEMSKFTIKRLTLKRTRELLIEIQLKQRRIITINALRTLTHPDEIAYAFNNYFVNIGINSATAIDDNNDYTTYTHNLQRPAAHYCTLNTITNESAVVTYINKMV